MLVPIRTTWLTHIIAYCSTCDIYPIYTLNFVQNKKVKILIFIYSCTCKLPVQKFFLKKSILMEIYGKFFMLKPTRKQTFQAYIPYIW